MKRFEHHGHREAIAHAAGGEQALHVWKPGPGAAERFPNAPAVFKRHSKTWAHLFDQDAGRLTKTARRLGVRTVVIDRPGDPRQHIDLCGKPLDRAIAECTESKQASLGLLLALVVALTGCGADGDATYCYGSDADTGSPACAEASTACIAEAGDMLTADAQRIGDAAALARYDLRVSGCLDELDRCAHEATRPGEAHHD